MALKESNMLPLGTEAPNFSLPDTVSGETLTYQQVSEGKKGMLVMFICNHCPYVIHVNPELKRIADEYSEKGVGIVAISSNDVNSYPQDGPEAMKSFAIENGFDFPYLYDESQNVARAYDAACTPDFYIFDKEGQLVYRGRLDGSRPGNNISLDGSDLRRALDNMLLGGPPLETQYPSAGCSMKWKD
jgi:peroxiredoxin